MEHAVQLQQYIVFDFSGANLRCFGTPAPAMEHSFLPYGTQVTGLEALHRTSSRLSRTSLAVHPADQVIKAMAGGRRPQVVGDAHDAVSGASTSGVGAVAVGTTGVDGESEDEVESYDEFLDDESFGRKIAALAELVGMAGTTCQPLAVLGEVVRVIQEMERYVCATGAV